MNPEVTERSTMKCNQPMNSWRKGKKKVVKACLNGEEKILHYGAVGYDDYTIHKDIKRRKNFRARHRCDSDPPKKTTPRYWACYDLW
jgi:hypothetical protein